MFHANLRTTARQLMPVGIGAVKCGARGLATTTPPQNFRVLGVQQIAEALPVRAQAARAEHHRHPQSPKKVPSAQQRAQMHFLAL